MKNILFILIACLGMLVPPSIAHEGANLHLLQKKQVSVYITKTGSKYHTSSCRYLRQSKIEMAKKVAVASGYTACSVCNP